MSTATGRWEIPGHAPTQEATPPRGHSPYPDAAPTQPTTTESPVETPAEPPAPPAEEPVARPKKASRIPLVQWFQDMRGDSAARRARSEAKWAMRWMGEQPTSIRDHVDYLLHERYMRKDGRKGWGWRTEGWGLDALHALIYRLYGLTIGLAVSMACYALAWMAQRPGRFFLLAALIFWLVRA